LQQELVVQRQAGTIPDTLILVEHPDVITMGRSARPDNIVDVSSFPVFAIERGGDVTYHGPGQLVAYPIFHLRETERDLHRYLRGLEETVLRALADFGIVGTRRPGLTGVWTADKSGPSKLASIGVAVRKWVTLHGLALNVNTKLARFAGIHPCGFDAGVMTSMARELGQPVDFAAVKSALAAHVAEVFDRAWIQAVDSP
jgi:lipoyl(octanoyl) transferase